MSIPFVDLKAQYRSIETEIEAAIRSCIDQTSFIGGDAVAAFEALFAAYTGSAYAIGCANGTDAIEIALKALGIGPGDEVIVPALTWISTAGAVSNVGAEPVFADVLEAERTIDPASVENKITRRTKAIIPVHLYGLPARMPDIMDIAGRNNLEVIEDSAQAHGADIGGTGVGAFGRIATYSFFPGKNLGAYGDAGAITTNDERLATTCRMIKNHGQLNKHDHKIIGRNSRMDTMQAAILKAKLPYLESWTAKRRAHAAFLDAALKTVTIPAAPAGYKHVYHIYAVLSDERDRLKALLSEHKIGYSVHYPRPLPLIAPYAYQGHCPGDFPVAEKLCARVLSLPMFPEMTAQQLQKVAETVNEL